MKHLRTVSQTILILFFLSFSMAGYAQEGDDASEETPSGSSCLSQISTYINSILQDQQGNYWFATHGFGACRYDGNTFTYFSTPEGLSGANVRDMAEDKEGNLWFATTGGITKFTDGTMTHFTEEEGLASNDVWSIAIDSKGIIWVGTLEGVDQLDPSEDLRTDGSTFTHIALPEAKLDYAKGIRSKKIVRHIMEDSKGNMWFGTNGGAYIYSPSGAISNLSEKDGLCSNAIKAMVEDKSGNIWIATSTDGVSRFNPRTKTFTNFTTDGTVSGKEAWSIHEDQAGNIWFSAVGQGMYRFDPMTQSFTNFQEEQGLASHALRCIYEDKAGRLWVGGWRGAFRYDGECFTQVTQNGPW